LAYLLIKGVRTPQPTVLGPATGGPLH
jgi:hypothetical protein